MTTFEQKYLKYKTKYLALKNLNNVPNYQNGGSNDLLDIMELSDTPHFSSNKQLGGGSDNILEITNLSETPTMFENKTQDGGKKAKKNKNKKSKKVLSESSSEDSNITTESGGGYDTGKKTLLMPFNSTLKLKSADSSSSDYSTSDSSDMLFSNSSESILSELEDSMSD